MRFWEGAEFPVVDVGWGIAAELTLLKPLPEFGKKTRTETGKGKEKEVKENGNFIWRQKCRMRCNIWLKIGAKIVINVSVYDGSY